MAYLTYDEYLNMGGALSPIEYDKLAFEAESYIDWYTFNRLQDEDIIPDRVKKCMYHIIELMRNKSALMNTGDNANATTVTQSGIISQSNDGVSVSYNVLTANEILELSKSEVDNTIKRYLQGVTNSLGRKLLYRGIYPDE